MKKKLIALILTAVMLLPFGVFGCGSDDGTIRIVADATAKAYMQQVINAYNNTNPVRKVKGLYNADQDGLIRANKAPDILFTNNLDTENKYNYALGDLKPYMDADASFDKDGFYGGIIDNMKNAKGEIRGIPVSCNVSLLYYNKAVFDAYNTGKAGPDRIEYPDASWTLADFRTAAQKLTFTKGGVSYVGAEITDTWWGEWLIYVRDHGGNYMNAEQTDITLDTPQAKAGFAYMLELYQSGYGSKGNDSFRSGTAAMMMGGHTGSWKTYNTLGLDWDIAPLPTLVAGQRLPAAEISADVYGISVSSKYKDDAWKFLKYLTGYEGQSIINKAVPNPSCLKAIGDDAVKVPVEERSNPKSIEAMYSVQMNYVQPLPTYRYFRSLDANYVEPEVQRLFAGDYKKGTMTASEQVDAMMAVLMPRARAFIANPS